ncbi:hypothetical protein F4561_000474 [Lipingzhangella halophila]|uniref:Uncharacterized protein n=1 Tax=Lipingzhangella halophila TaxID=1783352 RepID=A0A7W7W1D9_9ACTN|nr:hypothetical protein [Lipingzhangella halophila]MBB4929654.1 hypothetical protein [Lipingzhangella halophila]
MSYEAGLLVCFAAGALSGVVVCVLHAALGQGTATGAPARRFFVLSASALAIGWTLAMFDRGIGVNMQSVLSTAAGLSLSALLIAWGKVLFTRRDRYGDLLTGAAVGTATGLVSLPTVFVTLVGAPLAGAVSGFVAGAAAMGVRRSFRCGALGTVLGVLAGCIAGALALLATLPLATFALLYLSALV